MSVLARALAVLLGLLASCGDSAPASASRPRRVVLVVLDSVRADRLGALGHPRALTPRLDALAKDGVLFERAYAASSFGPQALAALWTGHLPSAGGATGPEAVPHPSLTTLPRLFRAAGYRTALATNSAALRARGLTRGFDELEVDSVSGRWSAERVTHAALELVDSAGDAPLFLVVDYADAGEPHQAPEALRRALDVPVPAQPLTLPELRAQAAALPPDLAGSPAFQDLVARYDAEVAYVDQSLGRLVDGLASRGRLADTLLVVTASHGVEFLEHGYVGSGWTLHEEVLRVPLVVHAPRRLEPGRVATPVSLADLFPSLQRILLPAGERLLARPPSAVVLAELVLPELCVLRASIQDETKLVEALQSAAPPERQAHLAGYAERLARIGRGEAQPCDPFGAAVRRELYDLHSDAAETRDLAAAAPDRCAALAAALARYLELARRTGLEPAALRPPADAGEPVSLEELRQIGYL
jgi:arylsulfatase A-like enzyme